MAQANRHSQTPLLLIIVCSAVVQVIVHLFTIESYQPLDFVAIFWPSILFVLAIMWHMKLKDLTRNAHMQFILVL